MGRRLQQSRQALLTIALPPTRDLDRAIAQQLSRLWQAARLPGLEELQEAGAGGQESAAQLLFILL